MTEHAYDPELPYVVEPALHTHARARFNLRSDAEAFAEGNLGRIIDTTPKPRVPDDAKFITWVEGNLPRTRWFAARVQAGWEPDNGTLCARPEDLPGVTPDTVFTVLDERKS